MARKKRVEKEGDGFTTIFNSYTKNLSSLKAFVDNVAPTVEKYDSVVRRKIDEIFRKIFDIAGAKGVAVDKKRERINFEVRTYKQAEQIAYLLKGLPRLPNPQTKLLYQSSFVMLICYFDFLISDIIQYYYRTYPEGLSGKELMIGLSELKLCNDLKEAIDSIVNKKVEAILYTNLKSQKNYFNSDLKIDTKDNHINWEVINEAVERRNIIVHNDSKINRRYLKNVDLSVITEKAQDIKEGKEIVIDNNYFKNVSNEFLIAGILLIQCCWRQWRKDEADAADSKLINAMYEALLEENWTVAERLGLASKEFKTHNEANRLYLDVNYCQSLKWQNKGSELKKELEYFDRSTISPKYVLALCALESDRDGFYENIENAIIVDKMAKEDFTEWPLFRELRKEAIYEDRINRAFSVTSEKQQEVSDSEIHETN